MKVYVVMNYSEEGAEVLAVFSTQENANAFVKGCIEEVGDSSENEYEVQEYTLDKPEALITF